MTRQNNHQRLMIGTLAECYEKYPTLACVDTGRYTASGLIAVAVGYNRFEVLKRA